MTGPETTPYRYGGARALVELLDRSLREFLAVWREARRGGLEMPPTEDPDCASLPALLRHVLHACRGELVWCCDVLDLPGPRVPPVPMVEEIEADHARYAEDLLAAWRASPLRDVEEERFYRPEHLTSWGVRYCVDAMLEHAVMHPIRHAHQLRRALDGV